MQSVNITHEESVCVSGSLVDEFHRDLTVFSQLSVCAGRQELHEVSVVTRLQNLHPVAFIAISGDFNHATLDSTLPKFKHFVDERRSHTVP